MSCTPWALRIGESILRRICHELPANEAHDCFAEWSAELPAIWSDETLPRWRAAIRVLAYCLGQRATAQSLTPPPDDDPAEMHRAAPLIGGAVLLSLSSDTQSLVGDISNYTADLLILIGVITLRPRRSRRSNGSGKSG
ncbi:hypothetical protein ACH4UY_29170 [Streptomyces longwoodensis]|uniref:hypothetical protein n=1 Tax=Streptomyces longwoodensis TaxID=68231 RepID=UPI003789F30F